MPPSYAFRMAAIYIFIDPDRAQSLVSSIGKLLAFARLWTDICRVGWLEEDRQRFIIGANDPGNFDEDNDAELRASFRTELHRRNPDLFPSFLGAVELRAVLHAAMGEPHHLGCTGGWIWMKRRWYVA